MSENNYIIKGDNTIAFGLGGADVSTPGKSAGYLQSASLSNGTDKWEGRDESGNVVSTVLYNQNGEFTCEFLLKNDSIPPGIGDNIRIKGVVGYVESVQRNWQSQEGVKFTLTGKWYDGVKLEIPV